MRTEKQYLVREVDQHLAKSSYFFLADFNRVTVSESADIRKSLAAHQAEYHVVKNSIFEVALKARQLPSMKEVLVGQTVLVSGGGNPSEVAKILVKFAKDKEKLPLKAGVMDNKVLSSEDIVSLSKLPSLEVLRAQLLGLLNTPAQQLLRVFQAVPQGVLNVLQAKSQQ